MKKLCVCFIILMCLPVTIVIGSSESTEPLQVEFEDRNLPDIDEFAVMGELPRVTLSITPELAGAGSSQSAQLSEVARLQQEINTRIEEIQNAKMDAGRLARVRSVTFSYKVESTDAFESIIIYTNVSRPGLTQYEADSIVIDKNSLSLADISTVFGPNGVKLINSHINALIWSDLSKYNPSFSGITEFHSFFIRDDSAFIIFDSYEITKGSPDLEILELPIDLIRNYSFQMNGKEISPMIPLRDVCEFFGYDVVWNGFYAPVEITRDDFYTEVIPFVNRYKKGSIDITLEAAPAFIEGTTKVPVTFFEEVLGLSYYVDEDFIITFSDINPEADQKTKGLPETADSN